MKSERFLVVVTVLALITVVIGGETAQTQGPTGGEPVPAQSGTAGTGLENPRALTDGSSGQEEDAVSDQAASYNASLRIPAVALRPRESNVEWGVGGAEGCIYVSGGNRYTWWVVPFYLPDGASLRYFRMYYNDQSTEVNCAAYLTVYDRFGNIVLERGIFSRNTGQDYVTSAELEHEIDYGQYSYVIKWSPNMIGSSMQVCGFRLYYEYTWGLSFLPSVMNGY